MLNRLLFVVVMLTLFVARCGDRIALGLRESEVMGQSRSEQAPLDPNSEEGKRAAQIKRDFELMQRAEQQACRCGKGPAPHVMSACWQVCLPGVPVVADGRQQPP